MIELDRTDEEREELVKQWIKDYWLYVVIVVALTIGIVWGLNRFHQSKINALSKTAVTTEQITNDLQADKLDAASNAVKDLQNTQANTSFSTVSTLALAKKLFDTGKFGEAAQQYQWLIANSGDAPMRDIARLRKARAESNAKQYDNAIMTLGGIESKDYVIEANLLKGDIYMVNQQFDKAKDIYETIQEESNGLNPEVTQQRLDLLSIKQQKSVQ